MKILRLFLGAMTVAALCACSTAPKGSVGLIDVQRISSNWPKFLNYQNQLAADSAAIERSGKSEGEKARARAALQDRFTKVQTEVTNDVADAAKHVAADKNLTYVFTRQFVGYGGIDITPDVEKRLNITETSPKP